MKIKLFNRSRGLKVRDLKQIDRLTGKKKPITRKDWLRGQRKKYGCRR